jgi:hypothetical protein
MSETQDQIDQIEKEIEDLKSATKEYEALQRLEQNPDFKLIIEKGYFLEDAARMLLLKDDPSLNEDLRKHLQADMAGPGALKRYFFKITQVGMGVNEAIADAEETLEELRAEYAGAPGFEILGGEHE